MTISIVVPCFNEYKALPLFYTEICFITKQLQGVQWELLFIDDGSNDGTLNLIRQLADDDKRVHYVSFSRNFGKEAAIYAGLQKASGDYIAVLDADLQHPPSMLLEMFNIVKSGEYDCAAARRVTREGEPYLRSVFSRTFYRLANKITNIEFVDGATDYRMMNRKMVNAVLSVCEYNRFSKGIFAWVGFRTKWIVYQNVKRVAGETKWSFWKLILYSLEGIVAFTTTPLMISSILGIITCAIALIMLLVVVIETIFYGNEVAGFPTLISVILLLGGLQMLFIGVLGQYLAKTYLETKRRPIYIVRETEEEQANCEK